MASIRRSTLPSRLRGGRIIVWPALPARPGRRLRRQITRTAPSQLACALGTICANMPGTRFFAPSPSATCWSASAPSCPRRSGLRGRAGSRSASSSRCGSRWSLPRFRRRIGVINRSGVRPPRCCSARELLPAGPRPAGLGVARRSSGWPPTRASCCSEGQRGVRPVPWCCSARELLPADPRPAGRGVARCSSGWPPTRASCCSEGQRGVRPVPWCCSARELLPAVFASGRPRCCSAFVGLVAGARQPLL